METIKKTLNKLTSFSNKDNPDNFKLRRFKNDRSKENE